jgi:hypothetical protein
VAVQAREVIKRAPPARLHVAYKTSRGAMLRGSLESFLESDLARAYRGRVHHESDWAAPGCCCYPSCSGRCCAARPCPTVPRRQACC